MTTTNMNKIFRQQSPAVNGSLRPSPPVISRSTVVYGVRRRRPVIHQSTAESGGRQPVDGKVRQFAAGHLTVDSSVRLLR
jgi:hypothetical protein